MKYEKILYGPKTTLEYENLAKAFIPENEFKIVLSDKSFDKKELICDDKKDFDKNNLKREIYRELSSITGIKLPWGITTGIRPIKLAGNFVRKLGKDKAIEYLQSEFYFSEEKARLACDMYCYQNDLLKPSNKKQVSIYIGIPFCPTKCKYCSFTSYRGEEKLLDEYVTALIKEIEYVGKKIKEKKFEVESLYIGGGTPTTLTEKLLDKVLNVMDISLLSEKNFLEYTVEAGRADTVNKEKLEILNKYGVTRISINPQTIHSKTLDLIGRKPYFEQVERAYEIAREVGNFKINMDVILGLEGENLEDFEETLKKIIHLKPDNITVHPLAIKSGSRQEKEDRDINYKRRSETNSMAEIGDKLLKEADYKKYYLYRQKNIAGGLENTGYGLDSDHCVYNIRIMEEKQTIIGIGAGAVSKIYNNEKDTFVRSPNIVDPRMYIDRIEEMIERKNKI